MIVEFSTTLEMASWTRGLETFVSDQCKIENSGM